MCEGETMALYGMSVEEKLMTLLGHVCGANNIPAWRSRRGRPLRGLGAGYRGLDIVIHVMHS